MADKDKDIEKSAAKANESGSLNPESAAGSKPSAQEDRPVQAPSLKNSGMSAKIKAPEKPKKDFSAILNYLKMFLVIIVEAGVILMIVIFVIVPGYNRYIKLTPQLESKKAEQTVIDQQVSYLRAISALGGKLDQYSILSKQAIPISDAEIPYYLNQLLYMAEQSGAVVAEQSYIGVKESDGVGTAEDIASLPDVPGSGGSDPFAPFPEGIGDPLSGLKDKSLQDLAVQAKADTAASKIAVKMGIEGPYENLAGFLKRLENSRRLMDVVAIELKAVEEESASEGGSSAQGVKEPVYKLGMSINGYFLKESDASGLDVKILISKPVREEVLNVLSKMDYYDVDPAYIEIGKTNPFEDSSSVSPVGNSPAVPPAVPNPDTIPLPE